MVLRSKNGCLSCKKLKIKCDEARPRCEYCVHTKRECGYVQYYDNTALDEFNERQKLARPFILDQDRQIAQPPNGDDPNAKFSRFYSEEEVRSYNQLIYNRILIDPSSQLSITKFEYRLLDFFHNFCIQLFSLGVNPEIEAVWRNHVPGLFMRSPVVRSSVYSFAALNLLPLCDLNQMSFLNRKRREYFDLGNPDSTVVFSPYLTPIENLEKLHGQTIAYFVNAITLVNRSIGYGPLENRAAVREKEQNQNGKEAINANNASEFAISSILMFSYLSLQPGNSTPLVSWDKSVSDLLSITKGMRYILARCAPLLANTEFAGLVFINVISANIGAPSLARSTFPLIRKLNRDLLQEYSTYELTLELSMECEIIRESINILHVLIYRSSVSRSPNPTFRWLLALSDGFRDLVYSKRFYALRTLFTYSCIVLLMRLEIFSHDNVWMWFVRSYKRYNWELFGRWKYSLDEMLFIVVHDGLYKFTRFNNVSTFDPEIAGCEVLLTKA